MMVEDYNEQLEMEEHGRDDGQGLQREAGGGSHVLVSKREYITFEDLEGLGFAARFWSREELSGNAKGGDSEGRLVRGDAAAGGKDSVVRVRGWSAREVNRVSLM